MPAVYNVARYLPEFIASVDAQGFPPEQLEVVAVDDGSEDESLRLLQDWAERAAYHVKVLSKSNGGQSTARNLGLEHVTGEWVTFTDPDDILDAGYLQSVDDFITANPDVELIVANRIFFDDEPGTVRDEHPLRAQFSDGNGYVNLDRQPEYFPGSAPAAFFRRARIRQDNLTFDERIRPNFEDGHFCARYMLGARHRSVGFIADARYLYRKRSDLSSTLQNSLMDPRRYNVVPELGYLDVMRRSVEVYGQVPEWLQNFIIYELSWYFSAEEASNSSATAASGEVADAFHAVIPQIVALLSPQVVRAFGIRWLSRITRELLLHAWGGEDWHTPYAVVDNVDHDKGLARVVHRYVGRAPDAEYLVDGLRVAARHTKVRHIHYFDRTVMFERIAWVTTRGSLRVRLAGELAPIRRGFDGAEPTSRTFTPPAAVDDAPSALSLLAKRARKRAVREAVVGRGRRAVVGRGRDFDGAWVLVDRIHDADDSAEVLFRHLRDHRPDINAWFTVERGTADWDRLRREGYGDRLVAWGGMRWRALMASCSYLISSHIDAPIHRPPEVLKYVVPRWKFVFLQHGIIKDDLSNWLNTKKVDLFVTSTTAEYASIAGDGTGYKYTTREVRNTGLPRFDRLLDVGAQYPAALRDLVVVAPTWRNWLIPPLAVGSQRREVPDTFWETDYAANWLGVLRSERLAHVVAEQGLRLAFLPHPNLQSVLDSDHLPDHVVPLRFVGEDVRRHFARAAALMTDYSSMAFNAAYLDRPVTYFQFDADQMFGGGHVGRGGYFKYERDGLGPVAYDRSAAVDDLIKTLEYGRDPQPEYADRIRRTFPHRDGRACERLVPEIQALRRPTTDEELRTPIPAPVGGE